MKMSQHVDLLCCCFVLTTLCFVTITGESLEEWFETTKSTVGETASMLTRRSSIHCSASCVLDKDCRTYQYSTHKQKNCVLIHEATQNGNTFVSDEKNQMYKIVIIPEVWSPPADWTDTKLPAVYRSFDNDKYVQLENGAQVAAGKVNGAISTDNTQRQWVSLGNLSIACLTIPHTCGSTGGALSAWIKLGAIDSPDAGIISSFDYSEGFHVFVYNNVLRYHVYFRTIYIRVDVLTIPTDWYHLVFNYFGTTDAEGVTIYHDGVVTGSSRLVSYTNAEGQGVVVLGRYNVRTDYAFASVVVDELLFFNRHLTSLEVQILYNMHE